MPLDLDIDFAGELNPDQYAAVVSPPDRPVLVLAGAGSGKTRTLTYRVAWLISKCGLSPREILLLTFTNKAAAQMLSRISELTACSQQEFWGGTFHAVGNRFLRIEHEAAGIAQNFSIIDTEDSEKLLKRVLEENFHGFLSSKDNPRPKLLREIISYARNTRQGIAGAMAERFDWIETPARSILDISNAYAELRRRLNCCDFDDLLELWLDTLEKNPGILEKYRRRFSNILVDEYQDTNMLQSDILDLLADRGQISAVGDDAQCIYSWRGAEIGNILEFRERYPAVYVRKIERNYRSTRQILDFANAVLGQMPSDEAYRKTLVSAREGEEKPIVVPVLDAQSQARKVVSLISSLELGGRYSYGDMAVLYRSHFQAMDLQLQLQSAGIPFIMTSGVKFFEQAHIKDVIAQIRFAANPSDFVSFMRIARFMPKVGDKTARKIFDCIKKISDDAGKPVYAVISGEKILSKVPSAAREVWREISAGLASLGKMFCSDIESSPRTAAGGSSKCESSFNANSAEGQADFFSDLKLQASNPPNPQSDEALSAERRIAACQCDSKSLVKMACESWYLKAMKTIYEDWDSRAEDFDALYEYAGRYNSPEEFLANATLEASEQSGDEGGSGKDSNSHLSKVKLMTVHQAKGLEFPVVFIIGAADGLFPSKRSLESGDTDEELRLFYVAATRAKDLLIITYPRISLSNGSYESHQASRFLEGVDPSLYRNLAD